MCLRDVQGLKQPPGRGWGRSDERQGFGGPIIQLDLRHPKSVSSDPADCPWDPSLPKTPSGDVSECSPYSYEYGEHSESLLP